MQVDEERRKKTCLHTIADHEQEKTQVANRQVGMHPELLSERAFLPDLDIKSIVHRTVIRSQIALHCRCYAVPRQKHLRFSPPAPHPALLQLSCVHRMHAAVPGCSEQS